MDCAPTWTASGVGWTGKLPITRQMQGNTRRVSRTSDQMFAILGQMKGMHGDTTTMRARLNALLRVTEDVRTQARQINGKTP